MLLLAVFFFMQRETFLMKQKIEMNQSRRGRPPHRFSPLHDDGSYLSPAKQQQQQLPYSLWCLQPDKPKNTKKMNGLKDSSLSLSSAFCTSVSVYVQTSSSSTSFPTPHPIAHLTGFSQLGRTVKYRPPFLLPKSLVETVISRVIDTSRDCLKWRKTPKKEIVETWESREWRNLA